MPSWGLGPNSTLASRDFSKPHSWSVGYLLELTKRTETNVFKLYYHPELLLTRSTYWICYSQITIEVFSSYLEVIIFLFSLKRVVNPVRLLVEMSLRSRHGVHETQDVRPQLGQQGGSDTERGSVSRETASWAQLRPCCTTCCTTPWPNPALTRGQRGNEQNYVAQSQDKNHTSNIHPVSVFEILT